MVWWRIQAITAAYRHIDPLAFRTADIYAQALKERDRQAALQQDLEGRLAQMQRWCCGSRTARAAKTGCYGLKVVLHAEGRALTDIAGPDDLY